MLIRLMALFVAVPLIEIALLIKLGEIAGFWPTFFLVVITGILGATLARKQGLDAWQKIQQELAQGRMPTSQLMDGLLILIGGIVLLTPGLITDTIGFLLLIPYMRRLAKSYLSRHFQHITAAGQSGEYFDEIDSRTSGYH